MDSTQADEESRERNELASRIKAIDLGLEKLDLIMTAIQSGNLLSLGIGKNGDIKMNSKGSQQGPKSKRKLTNEPKRVTTVTQVDGEEDKESEKAMDLHIDKKEDKEHEDKEEKGKETEEEREGMAAIITETNMDVENQHVQPMEPEASNQKQIILSILENLESHNQGQIPSLQYVLSCVCEYLPKMSEPELPDALVTTELSQQANGEAHAESSTTSKAESRTEKRRGGQGRKNEQSREVASPKKEPWEGRGQRGSHASAAMDSQPKPLENVKSSSSLSTVGKLDPVGAPTESKSQPTESTNLGDAKKSMFASNDADKEMDEMDHEAKQESKKTATATAEAPASPLVTEKLAEVPKKDGRGRPKKVVSDKNSASAFASASASVAIPKPRGRPPASDSRKPSAADLPENVSGEKSKGESRNEPSRIKHPNEETSAKEEPRVDAKTEPARDVVESSPKKVEKSSAEAEKQDRDKLEFAAETSDPRKRNTKTGHATSSIGTTEAEAVITKTQEIAASTRIPSGTSTPITHEEIESRSSKRKRPTNASGSTSKMGQMETSDHDSEILATRKNVAKDENEEEEKSKKARKMATPAAKPPLASERKKARSKLGGNELPEALKDLLMMDDCWEAWKNFMNNKITLPFREPVLVKHAADYYDVIKHPMDLRTLREKMENGEIKTPHDFMKDLLQICKNASIYNERGSPIESLAKEFRAVIRAEVDPIIERYKIFTKEQQSAKKSVSVASEPPTNSEGPGNAPKISERPAASKSATSAKAVTPSAVDDVDDDDDLAILLEDDDQDNTPIATSSTKKSKTSARKHEKHKDDHEEDKANSQRQRRNQDSTASTKDLHAEKTAGGTTSKKAPAPKSAHPAPSKPVVVESASERATGRRKK